MKAYIIRSLGYAMFAVLSVAMLGFCVWVKSWWDEPLGVDGLVLWFVLLLPLYKAFPIIEKLIFGSSNKTKP